MLFRWIVALHASGAIEKRFQSLMTLTPLRVSKTEARQDHECVTTRGIRYAGSNLQRLAFQDREHLVSAVSANAMLLQKRLDLCALQVPHYRVRRRDLKQLPKPRLVVP
jgi:hypothetical protein